MSSLTKADMRARGTRILAQQGLVGNTARTILAGGATRFDASMT